MNILTEEQEKYLADTYTPEDLIEILLDNEIINIYHVIEAFNTEIVDNYDLFES